MNMIERALLFAAHAHSGQTRKNSAVPYILHPAEAASIAATVTDDPEIIAAVLLHDTVEDTDTTPDDIRAEFGDRVADLVAGETEPQMEDVSRSQSWMKRKEDSLEHLRTSGLDVKIMWLSDKLSNMRSFCLMYYREGDAMWEHFNQKDKKVQEWYYRTISHCLADLSDTDAYKEFNTRVNFIYGRENDEN